jgi:alkylation response protein AidB-like acyl-CoA dehydrogenase
VLTDLHGPDAAAYRERVAAWLRDNLPSEPLEDPAFLSADADVERSRRWSLDLYEAGLVGLTWPVEYGGQGLGLVEQIIVAEELIAAGAPGHLGVIGTDIAGPTILRYGTDEQRARYLPPILTGEEIWCQGFSEPDAGSDLASLRTRGRIDGADIVIDGQKVWSSYAHLADRCLALVRTDPDAPPHKGITAVIVDMRAPGVEVRRLKQITGGRQFSEIFFDGVRVPLDRTVGAPGAGWKVTMTTLAYERATLGFRLLGRAIRQRDRVRELLPQADGTAETALVRDRMARLEIELRATQLFNYRSLDGILADGPGPKHVVAKLQWSETNQALTELAMTLALQGRAPAEDLGHWRYELLRSRGNTIEAGTSQILRRVIAEQVLGLPRGR